MKIFGWQFKFLMRIFGAMHAIGEDIWWAVLIFGEDIWRMRAIGEDILAYARMW